MGTSEKLRVLGSHCYTVVPVTVARRVMQTLLRVLWRYSSCSYCDRNYCACSGYIIIIMMGSYNARLIYPIGYSRRRCGATAALIRQPQTHPHNEEPEIRNRILWEGVRFLGVGGNRSARRKPTKAGMESANQIHIQPLASCIGERKVYEH